MDTEIGNLYNFHMSQNIILILIYFNLLKMQSHLSFVGHTKKAWWDLTPDIGGPVGKTRDLLQYHMLWWCSSIISIGGQVLSRRSAGTSKSLFPVCIKSTKNSSLIATASITPGLLSVNAMSSICWFPVWQNVFDPCFCYLIVVAARIGLVADVISMSFCLYVIFFSDISILKYSS